MTPLSYLSNAELDAFEGLYHQFQNDPYSVDQEWRNFFEGLNFQGQISNKRMKKHQLKVCPFQQLLSNFKKRLQLIT